MLSLLQRMFTVAVLAALASTGHTNDDILIYETSDLQELSNREWTIEQLDQVSPIELPRANGEPHNYHDGTAELLVDTAGDITGMTLVALSGGRWTVPAERFIPKGALNPNVGADRYPYTRYRAFPDRIFLYRQKPYRQIGRLVVEVAPGLLASCTASIINSKNLSVVWTAGHCVHSGRGGEFYTAFVFIPGHHQDEHQNECLQPWLAASALVPSVWGENSDRTQDFAALVMRPINGKPIGKACGFLGFLANTTLDKSYHIIGYPAAPRDTSQTPPGAQFDGRHQEICAAPFAQVDTQVSGAGLALGAGCDQTAGSSGGPWLVNFNGAKGMTNMVNSHVSYGYTNAKRRIYGPYLGVNAIALREAAQNYKP